MTKKESMYYELLCAKNVIKRMNGENELNVEEYCETYAFISKAKSYKMYELENEMERVQRTIEAMKQDKAREAWFETEEGKAFKAQNEAEQQAVYDQLVTLRNRAYKYTREAVQEVLGKEFDVTRFNMGNFEVGLIKEYNEKGKPLAYQWHTFTIDFVKDTLIDGGRFKFEMNYGTFGSFDISTDEQRAKYLMGMAKFAGSEEITKGLKDLLEAYSNEFEALRDEHHRLEQELKKAGK